jgi:Sporulation related domain.
LSPYQELKIMKKTVLLLLMFVFVIAGMSQNKGVLHLNQDRRIETLLRKQKEFNDLDSTFAGYRINIFMEIGNDAVAHADSIRADFESSFPEIPIYLSYGQPYYRLRVGDFRNRVEAEKYLRIIKPIYKESFVTADRIFPPKVELFPTEDSLIQDFSINEEE